MKQTYSRLLVVGGIAAIVSFLMSYPLPIFFVNALCQGSVPCTALDSLPVHGLFILLYPLAALIYFVLLRYIARNSIRVAILAAISSLILEYLLSMYVTKLSLQFELMAVYLALISAVSLIFHSWLFTAIEQKKPRHLLTISGGIMALYGVLIWITLSTLR